MRTPQEKRHEAAIKLASILEKTEIAIIKFRNAREKCGEQVENDSRALQREVSELAAWMRKVDWLII